MRKVYVGTLHSGEGDFDECCRSINDQRGVHIKHVVISGKSEQEAHELLFSGWMSERDNDDYAMFVKVDADTVLKDNDVFNEALRIFDSNQRVTSIQAPLHDHMTAGFINGLNFFRPTVNFVKSKTKLRPDHADVGHDIQMLADACPEALRPAGFHCHYANERQCFRYGLHRALKNQRNIIDKVKRAFDIHRDKRRGLALMGAAASIEFTDAGGYDYCDDEFNKAFERAMKNYDTVMGAKK